MTSSSVLRRIAADRWTRQAPLKMILHIITHIFYIFRAEEHHIYYTRYERPLHLAKFVSEAKNDLWAYGMPNVEELILVRTYQRKQSSKIRTRFR